MKARVLSQGGCGPLEVDAAIAANMRARLTPRIFLPKLCAHVALSRTPGTQPSLVWKKKIFGCAVTVYFSQPPGARPHLPAEAEAGCSSTCVCIDIYTCIRMDLMMIPFGFFVFERCETRDLSALLRGSVFLDACAQDGPDLLSYKVMSTTFNLQKQACHSKKQAMRKTQHVSQRSRTLFWIPKFLSRLFCKVSFESCWLWYWIMNAAGLGHLRRPPTFVRVRLEVVRAGLSFRL